MRESDPRTTYIWQRAAAPFVALLHEATGRIPRAARVAVTHFLGWSSCSGYKLIRLLQQGRHLLDPRQAEAPRPVAGLRSHITFVVFRTAVLVITTANSLEPLKCSLTAMFLGILFQQQFKIAKKVSFFPPKMNYKLNATLLKVYFMSKSFISTKPNCP